MMHSNHLKNVYDHVPLTAVADETARELVYNAIVQRLVRKLDSLLQVIVGLVQLVPEEQVGLRNKVR